MHDKYDMFDMKFLVAVRFSRERFRIYFFIHAFHVGVRQISQKLIYILVFAGYPCIKFMNRGMSTVQILCIQCDQLKEC